MKELENRKVLVVGLGKTGLSVCRFLHARGINFEVADDRVSPPGLDQVLMLAPQTKLHGEFTARLFCQYDVLIVSPGVAISHPAIVAASAAGCEVIGDIELFSRVVTAPVIAVTGSNGKSTVVAWLDSVFSQTSCKAILCGNIGKPVLDAIDPDADLYIVELSSFQLETTESLSAISATVLNVSEDHMDRYDTLEDYATAKRRIYRSCRYAVVNSEDERTRPVDEPVDEIGTMQVLEFGGQASREHCFGLTQVEGRPWLSMEKTPVLPAEELPLPGEHNIQNALAVLALLHPVDIEPDQVRAGLKAFRGLPHRTELIAERDGVRWFNDSKGTNVDASRRAIQAMGTPVVLIAGGLGKNADFSPMRSAVEEHVRAMILVGQDAALIETAMQGATTSVHATDMRDAVEQAARLARPGDSVLLSPACASFDMFDSFEHRGEVFSQEVLRLAA